MRNFEEVEGMICPCCGKEWNTDLHNSCICGAVITQKAPQNLPEAGASAERISSVVRSNATTGWIKISERLPEEGIYVIAFEPHCVNNPDKGIGICEVDSDFTAKKSDGSFWITHWMPLPDAPEV
jgi:hypothetical protein